MSTYVLDNQAKGESLVIFFILLSLMVKGLFAEPTPQAVPGISQWNVFDFGAKGDGKTDDTAAFQNAPG